MNTQDFAKAFALIVAGFANSAFAGSDLCSTVTFQAFGEPEQTVKDCADPDEAFGVAVTIDGVNWMTQGIGLVVPQTQSYQRGDDMQFLTIQVTKEKNDYTVRFQQVSNGQSIYWSGIMSPGELRDITIKGHKVKVHFGRQKS